MGGAGRPGQPATVNINRLLVRPVQPTGRAGQLSEPGQPVQGLSADIEHRHARRLGIRAGSCHRGAPHWFCRPPDPRAIGPPADRDVCLAVRTGNSATVYVGGGCVGVYRCRAGWGGRRHEPPEVAWLLPELDVGAEPELKPLEFELEPDEPGSDEAEPDEPDPDEVEPGPAEPEPELAEVPFDDEPDDDEVVWVDPGSASAIMPAAATLAAVTVVVADRTLARPCSRAAMAWRTVYRCAPLVCLLSSVTYFNFAYGASRLAMR